MIYKKISLSSTQIKEASDFSNSISTTHYSNRNQFDNEKRKQDQLIGKLGEFASFEYLKQYNISTPDCKIYSSNNKSWEADLHSKENNFHIKSQSLEQSKRFGMSWIFQFDRGKDLEIFNNKSNKDFVVFVVVSNKMEQVNSYICACVSVPFLHENNLFEEPVSNKLKGIKKAVYYSSLLKFESNLWQK